ncbi:MAG: DUF4389 domain-containing protein [Kibdelosporangium sp.]
MNPVRLQGRPDEQLSSWLWLVKWFLVIPHLIVLTFLWIAFWMLTVFAFFAILITGRYPRAAFDFNVGVMRWTWRVAFYAYGALGTDRYPPFSLGAEPDFPATLDVEYPRRLSRGLVLVKSWLLAIPHYIVVGFFLGGAGYIGWRWGDTALLGGGGLIAVLVLIGAVILLFTGKYPKGVQDFVLGMDRWVVRVGAYAALMTDEYPPFRLDTGPQENPAENPHESGASHLGSGRRKAAVVFGALAMLVGLGMVTGGGVALWADQTQRDANGHIATTPQHFSSATQVLRFEDVTVHGLPDWMLGDVRIDVDSATRVFVGIGPSDDVSRYLDGVAQDRAVPMNPQRMWGGRWMSSQLSPPENQTFWTVSSVGSGNRGLTWGVPDGRWILVVLNADTTAGVDVDLSVGATAPGLTALGLGLLGAGVVGLAGGVLLMYVGLRRRDDRPMPQG